MKWCRFKVGNRMAYGIVEDDTIVEVDGSPFDSYFKTSKTHTLGSAKLQVPVIPPTFYAAGLNYPKHIKWVAEEMGVEPEMLPVEILPRKPDIGYRAINALIAHEEPIVIPSDASDEVQYEGELVAVIGKRCKNVTEAQALDYVLGFTIGNDVSERTWQQEDGTMWRSKNTDTFKPMGPWIVTGLNPDDLHCTITLSGRVVFEYDISTAIYGVGTYISEMSRYLTLYPGDVVWMGTEGISENMKDGDVIEIEVSDIGVLRNAVVRER